mgnify:CR=1 FL=1
MKRKTYSEEVNFITLTVVYWIDIFIRREYKDFIIENLDYCQKKKGLKIFAYVLMTNHLHIIVSSTEVEHSSILRDFKSYTSKGLLKLSWKILLKAGSGG